MLNLTSLFIFSSRNIIDVGYTSSYFIDWYYSTWIVSLSDDSSRILVGLIARIMLYSSSIYFLTYFRVFGYASTKYWLALYKSTWFIILMIIEDTGVAYL